MKLIKYKIYLKSLRVIEDYPIRIKQLHRSKWKQFVSRRRYKIRRYRFKAFFLQSFPKKRYRFLRMKKYYKESITEKFRLQQIYDNSLNFKKIKKNLILFNTLKYYDFIKVILVKPLYNLNILLYKLHFFLKVVDASNSINNKKVLVNGKAVKPNYFLKFGDVITFEEKNFSVNIKSIFNKYYFYPTFCSFIEIDSYTGSLVVIKDFNDLTDIDLTYLFSRPFNLRKIINNLR